MKDLKRGIRRAHRDRLKKNRKNYWGRYQINQYTDPLTECQLNRIVDTPKSCSCQMCKNKRRSSFNKGLFKLTVQERKFLESWKEKEYEIQIEEGYSDF
jgi:hypothetical protein